MTSRTNGRRVVTRFHYGSTSPATGPETLPFTRTPRPAETQHYHYHPSGQTDSATALDADVTRTYHASGALLSETLGIRDRARSPTLHRYTLTYEYDRNGRRTARTLGPSALFDATAMRTYFGSWGAVDSVTDIARNRFEFDYRQDGALISTLYPGSVRQTRTYDVFGRDSTDRIARAGSTAWPYFPDTLIRDFKVATRNARGQILTASDASSLSGAVPSVAYDSVGHLIRSRIEQRGYVNTAGALSAYVSGDTMTYDGLGNILTTRNRWSLGTTTDSDSSQNTYAVTTGRLTARVQLTPSATNTTQFTYDAGGNTRFESTVRAAGGTIAAERASYYGADDRLIATDARTPGKQLVEEYRYDALGRRVWVSTRWRCAPSSPACIANAVTRTIWDGTNEVAEIRAQYDTSAAATEELDAGAPLVPKSTFGDANPFYGRVVYGPGLALDQPLSVTRYEYRDNPDGADALAWPTFTVVPFWDYRGAPVFGLFADGTYRKPYAVSSDTACAASPGAGTTNRCVSLTWPFAGSAYQQDRGLVLTFSWHGSLLLKKKDVSGLTYARNRMYDPATGRFTQEDPIGLAGGLNAYGFASGDPVNFADPFGLCPDVEVSGSNIVMSANIETQPSATVADATAVAKSIRAYWAGNNSGYIVSINLTINVPFSTLPSIYLSRIAKNGTTAGSGKSYGPQSGGEINLVAGYPYNIAKAVPAHEFGHVLGLDHDTSPSNLMTPDFGKANFPLSTNRQQLAQAVANCDKRSQISNKPSSDKGSQ